MSKRDNRLWLPEFVGVQATFCLCEKCGEAYEAAYEHICRKVNSYPPKEGEHERDGNPDHDA